jgi:ribosomal protein S18 acetylase RimI-like enzyme
MAVDIVALSAENRSLLECIAVDVFDNPIDPQQLAAFLVDPRHFMVLAVEDDMVVGMASGVEYFHPDKPPQLWINEVGVASTHRRRGIGKALIASLLQVAKTRGCQYAWLGTDHDNVAAQACFGSVPGVANPQPFLLYEWEIES